MTIDAGWMLYGATGYTGRLIAEACAERGLRPLLGGRDATALATLAATLRLPHRTIDLRDGPALVDALRGLRVVLHCAGPFSATSAPMRAACIAAGVHYLDITGEIDVFEAAQADDERARQAGVLLCPGVGFDVVPTDCVAAVLKEALPDATSLALGFRGVDRLSAGTAATSLEAIRRGATRVRQAGLIVDLPFGARDSRRDFGRGLERSFVIPWGDVSTAFRTTGIPDIEVHVPYRSSGARLLRTLLPWRRLLATPAGCRAVHALMRRVAPGPAAAARDRERAFVWGEVRNAAGARRRAVLETLNAYALTVRSAMMAVQHVLSHPVPAGTLTPSRLMGARCVERIPGAGAIRVL